MSRTAHERHGGNCVAYAREVTGIRLDGDAASWWPHADGRYARGNTPSPGAVLVFKPYGRMHVGHVAVVSRVVGTREILVDQANWVRGQVTRSMSVIDASPFNDWTSVKVQFAGTHGRANPTYGFIYPRSPPGNFDGAIVGADHDRHHAAHADRAAAHAKHDKDRHHERALAKDAGAARSSHHAAAETRSHVKHKVADAKVAYVY